ncbi:MAG: hypothetical protein KME13_19355 [Myxacorys californica WJT36-NPBG1]|jgi:hypothetical protein|nr:hypothetical protein [Myxacorys californica WJT36-NPBG1]
MSCKLFWRVVRLTYPWLPLVMTLWRIAGSTDIHRQRAQVRFWILFSRIKFANLLAIAIDLIQPEYWV